MNSFLSIFVTAVADYLLSASVAALVLVAVVWGFVRMGRVKGPANRHMVWLFTLLAIVLLPAIWLHVPKLTLSVLPAQVSPMESAPMPVDVNFTVGPIVESGVGTSAASTIENLAPEADVSPSFGLPSVMTLLVWGWCIGFMSMLIRLTVGGVNLRELLRTAESVSDSVLPDSGGSRRVKLLVSQMVDCPVCFGLLRPVILMPKRMYEDVRPEDLRMILRHELAHIERKDCWINLFQRLVEAVLFFHPLVWYASYQLTQQREELCDQHVIAGGESAENYVEMLGRIARQGFEKRALQAVALFEGRLLSRVRSLLRHNGKVQVMASRKALWILAVAGIMCLMAGTVRLEARSETTGESSPPDGIQTIASERPQEERMVSGGSRPVGDCSFSGIVASAFTGWPVADASIVLVHLETEDSILIKAASDGSFFFDNIPSGKYMLGNLHAPGYQDAGYNPGEESDNEEGLFFLAEGEKRTGVIYELEPNYTISGRILGEDGQPPANNIGLTVTAVKKQEESTVAAAEYQMEGRGYFLSDGSYQLEGLSGDPVLVVVKQLGLSELYYPGTVSRDQAKLVDFEETKSRENIDILVSNAPVVVEGFVTEGATGDPVADAVVTVDSPGIPYDDMSTRTDERGYFRVGNVVAGAFSVHIDARESGYAEMGLGLSAAAGDTVRVNVGLKTPAFISGFFIDENGDPVNVSGKVRVSASTFDTITGREGLALFPVPGIFPAADTFLIEGILPGETHLLFDLELQGSEVKKIFYNGEEILTTIALPEGEKDLEHFEAVLETQPGQVIKGITVVLGPVVNSP